MKSISKNLGIQFEMRSPRPMKKFVLITVIFFPIFTVASLYAKSIVSVTNEGPNLSPRITQAQVVSWPLPKIQKNGVRIFSTPFNFHDGFGDGPYDISDSINEGGRPTLQSSGTFLRVNGLDSQTCAECHFIKSNSTIPFTFGLGGSSAGGSNVLLKATHIDTKTGDYNGRFINSPFLFGVGGIELAAKEMTLELQALKQNAIDNPGREIDLITKGVFFGTIVADGDNNIDTSNVEGIDDDLVVRPFGRKGQFTTTRQFDVGALRFHFGMEPLESVGQDIDNDGDGVINEVTIGELSALNIWLATLPEPRTIALKKEEIRGFELFEQIGCAYCHKPTLQTNTRKFTFSFPEVAVDPNQNVFYEIDLVQTSGFKQNKQGGVEVSLFADLKRHYMGPNLAENFHLANDDVNTQFTTARLWGVADSGPYLHDGRALTITDAILMLGGEAQDARDELVSKASTTFSAFADVILNDRTKDEDGLPEIGKKEFDAMVKEQGTKGLTTQSQKVYGAVVDGTVFLNPKLENYNTPVHEFGHLWMNTAKELNPEAYRRGIELVADSDYVRQVKESAD